MVAGLLALQAEYAAWYDALPVASATPPAAALLAIVDLDLDELAAMVPPAELVAVDGHMAGAPPGPVGKPALRCLVGGSNH